MRVRTAKINIMVLKFISKYLKKSEADYPKKCCKHEMNNEKKNSTVLGNQVAETPARVVEKWLEVYLCRVNIFCFLLRSIDET